MEENRRTLKEAIGDFINNHPFITFFTVTSLIEAPAAIIKAIKWDGHYPNSDSENGSSSSDESTSVEEVG